MPAPMTSARGTPRANISRHPPTSAMKADPDTYPSCHAQRQHRAAQQGVRVGVQRYTQRLQVKHGSTSGG